MARPRKINKKLIELILNKISDGESLREIFETPNNGIDCSWPTFRKALVADDSLMSRYEKSKSLAVDFLLSDLEFKGKNLKNNCLTVR